MDDKEVFESINLASVVGRGESAGKTSSKGEIPASESATSDEENEFENRVHGDEEGPDVADFVSLGNGSITIDGQNASILGSINSGGLAGEIPFYRATIPPMTPSFKQEGMSVRDLDFLAFTLAVNGLNVSSILPQNLINISIPRPVTTTGTNFNNTREAEEPVGQFLARINRMLLHELGENMKRHAKLLQLSDNHLHRIRSMLLQNFHHLSDNYNSIHELRERELSQLEQFYHSMLEWDNKREKILHRISYIKSPENEHGSKLENLISASNDIDEEIENLETRLNSLKNKRKVLLSEIQGTSSVLESKSSKYVNAFKNMEFRGREAILLSLNILGIDKSEPRDLLKQEKVDVTFTKKLIEKRPEFAKIMKKGQVFSKDQDKSLHDDDKMVLDSQANPAILRPSVEEPDHDAYPSDNTARDHLFKIAFKQGFESGSKLSVNVKDHLKQILGSLITLVASEGALSTKKQAPIKLDDKSNTVDSRIDTKVLFQFLEEKIEKLRSDLLHSSKKATLFAESFKIWETTMSSLKAQELRLQEKLLEGEKDLISDDQICDILKSSINYLKESADLVVAKYTLFNNGKKKHNISLLKILGEEIKTLEKAKSIVLKAEADLENLSDLAYLDSSAYSSQASLNTLDIARQGGQRIGSSTDHHAQDDASNLLYLKKAAPAISQASLQSISSAMSDRILASDQKVGPSNLNSLQPKTEKSWFNFLNTKQTKNE